MTNDEIKKQIEKAKAYNLALRDQNICSLKDRKKDIERMSKTGIPLKLKDITTIKMCMHFALAELIQNEIEMLET